MKDASPSWRSSTFVSGLAGGVCLFLAFPPVGWSWLAWIAPWFWLRLIVRPQDSLGKHPYWSLWAAGALHWLAMMQGVRLAHWALYFGWLTLAAYLAIYPVMFVGLTRRLTHRWKWPLMIAAPVVWTGLELFRGRFLTGLSVALLGHTQTDWPLILQIADFSGGYGVSFLVMLTSAGVFQAFYNGRAKTAWRSLVPLAAVWAGVIGYGGWRLGETPPQAVQTAEPWRAALIQSSADVVFEPDAERDLHHLGRCWELSQKAWRKHPDLDLIVWPESMFAAAGRELITLDQQPTPEWEKHPQEYLRRIETQQRAFATELSLLTEGFRRPDGSGPQFLLGAYTYEIEQGQSRQYNSALWIDSEGAISGRYYKVHPVMFGEYIPLGEQFPWLYSLTPMAGGLARGPGPACFEDKNTRFAPNICFEATVPHLVRQQVAQLRDESRAPDVLVNVSNDGWFRGSSILDYHYASNVFRAIEHRRPVIVASNTGISVWLDDAGRVQKKSPRRQEDWIVAEIRPAWRNGLYTTIGDGGAGGCLAICAALSMLAMWGKWRTSSELPKNKE